MRTPLECAEVRAGQPLSILQRAFEGDHAAVKDYIDKYGDLIWAMAKRFTLSNEEAETVTQEIFLEIGRRAARFEQPVSTTFFLSRSSRGVF